MRSPDLGIQHRAGIEICVGTSVLGLPLVMSLSPAHTCGVINTHVLVVWLEGSEQAHLLLHMGEGLSLYDGRVQEDGSVYIEMQQWRSPEAGKGIVEFS